MMDTEAFREFKTGLTLLRDNYATRALPHIRKAVDLDKNNPYYMSYLGVVLARSEKKWAEAERLCDSAVRLKRNQAQLYLNLAEVYATAGRRDDAVEALQAGLKYARRDVRLTIAMNKLTQRRPPVLSFLGRKHPLNRQLGMLRHRALKMFEN
ncbi:MAG TPA: tetratricopeptide repeat protein [Candidatus Acidoferrales bacterium]|jgi:Flp pilus assembly protein TadD|nr:tetratricopeptide repeat protein [Candidatus Acidoferrales bacterium]